MSAELSKMTEQSKKEFKILSIDGGGIRGLIPAIFLEAIERSINKRIWEYFDLICGTSTGGIIALAIAAGIPMEEIRELYEKKGNLIFPFINKFNFISLIFGNGGRYPAGKLETILKGIFISNGKVLRMKDSKVCLCIPSVNISTGKVVLFKTPHKVLHPEEEKFSFDAEREMWVVARATSAAPAFFRTALIENSSFIDGGLWSNNPSLVGVTEARRIGFDLPNISLLSLGTGDSTYKIKSSSAKNMNLLKWGGIKGIFELTLEIQSQAVENQTEKLLNPDKYERVQYTFGKNIALDDVAKIGDLKVAGEYIVKEQKDKVINRFFGNIATNSIYCCSRE